MTTATQTSRPTEEFAASVTSAPRGSRWSRYAGSWGVALRMARRDVRRHKGRSALIAVMVAVPTMLLVFALTLGATSQVTGAEKIPYAMGSGQALVQYPQPGAVTQGFDPDASGTSSEGTGQVPIPGWIADGSSFDNAAAMSALIGTTAVPVLDESVTTDLDGRRLRLESLAFDVRSGVKDKVTIVSGRAPERAGEVLVSTAALTRGLPSRGALTLASQGTDIDVTVVGTATVLNRWNAVDLVTPEPLNDDVVGGSWILLGDPVSWDEVQDLNRHGLSVQSASVLRNPPPASALSPDFQDQATFQEGRFGNFAAIGGALLLVITTLLVGPAFAVSAARQRRTLALAASNGATTPQLRRTVLAQAIVLGAFAGLLGSALGIALAWVVADRTALGAWLFGGNTGPFEVPVVSVLAVTAVSVASAVIAALLPARRLGTLDIIGVMKGQSVSPRPSKLVFLVGAVLAGCGAAALLVAASRMQTSAVMIVAATLALVAGATMLAPMLLVGIARASAGLPVSLRMATRDAGRQRARSVPSVAAIMAGVAVLTMTLIASGSDVEQSRREYAATNLLGDALVSGLTQAPDLAAITSAARSVLPNVEVSPMAVIDTGDPVAYMDAPMPTEPYSLTSVNVVVPGCTPQQSVFEKPTGNVETFVSKCQRIGTDGMGVNRNSAMLFTSPEEIRRRLTALGRADAIDAVLRGAVVIARAPDATSVLTDGKVTIMTAKQPVDPTSTTGVEDPSSLLRDVRTVTVPAIEVPFTRDTMGMLAQAQVLATTEAAQALGVPIRVAQLNLHNPAGAITEQQSEQLSFVVGEDNYVETERGFHSELGPIIAILVGLFTLLLLVITLTSTALTLAEQEKDQATLAALGSGRGTRRVMAAAQAFTLCIIGVVLGIAIGIVPGIALAYPLTAQSWNPITGQALTRDPVLVFPWLVLLAFVVAVPAVAAGLAAGGIRKAPDATRRTA